MLFSDEHGWAPDLDQAAGRLGEAGAVVVGVDLRRHLDGADVVFTNGAQGERRGKRKDAA